jgi:hypothetical protein
MVSRSLLNKALRATVFQRRRRPMVHKNYGAQWSFDHNKSALYSSSTAQTLPSKPDSRAQWRSPLQI